MSNYTQIQEKLRNFTRKFYINEIIRGSIFFLSLGLIYFLFTLFIEHALWMGVAGRTVLFWLFITIELFLLIRFVVIPFMRLLGLKKGISDEEASVIIGRHFKEVEDKLLNVIQLKNDTVSTDLIEASIEQKSSELSPIPFRRAIEIKANARYLKYLVVPILIGLGIWLTGNKSFFTESLNRVVHHNTVFLPPAPFGFQILNPALETIEDQSFTLRIATQGEVEPEAVRIAYSGESFYLNRSSGGEWEYTFQFPAESVEFMLEGNEVKSRPYTLKVIQAPKITDFSMSLEFPEYTRREGSVIRNTGNAEVPEGTRVNWRVMAQNAVRVDFKTTDPKGLTDKRSIDEMSNEESGQFSLERMIRRNTRYQITSSNSDLSDYETLSYEIRVIRDEYPKIFVRSDADSTSRGPINFAGQLTDDYGISRLQVVARNVETGKQSIGNIEVGRADFEEFFYTFPQGIILDEGASYEIYFEVFDNDGINGAKKAASSSFFYRNKSEEELEKEILKEQEQGIETFEDSRKEGDDLEKEIDEFSKELKTKESTEWSDQKKLDEFIERQKKYREMMEKNSDKMLQNLKEMDEEDNEALDEKKQELEDRWEEMKDMRSKQDLIEELEKLADKLQKEDLIDKMERLKEQSKQEKRSLERILELTKQFYVEKKSARIMEKLQQLSEEQLDLSTEETNSAEEQEKLNRKFDSIQQEFDELREQNESLKEPMAIPDSQADEKLIEMDMKMAEKELEKIEKQEGQEQKKSESEAKKKQRSASARMKELSDQMQSGMMAMEMQALEENIEDLKQILKNLVIFSEDQEQVMMDLEEVTDRNAEYPALLKEQIKLKEHFEHIDDSIYTLSLRLVTLSSQIEKDLTDAHYNLNRSLDNMAENRIQQGRGNQQYTMTAANNLADMLSDMLESLQNEQPGSGGGSGQKEELSLPDIIKQQQGLMKEMQEGMQKQSGEGRNGQEQMSGEQFRMYQEQQLLREKLKELLDQQGSGSQSGKNALDSMEELEKILLEKGFTRETLERMRQLEYELLELENASMKKERDSKREATTNKKEYQRSEMEEILLQKLLEDEKERLRRENIRMNPDYQKRVKEYFEKQVDSTLNQGSRNPS
jgi:hypothetical protein